MRNPGSHFGALCSLLFEFPSGFSLGYSCSLSYIHAIFLKPFLPLKPCHLYVFKSIFQNSFCMSCWKCLPQWAPRSISPMCLPQNPAYIFSPKLSSVFPRTYFLCIFLRLSPLKTLSTDAIHICPSTFHHVSQKSIPPMILVPNSCLSCVNMCELELFHLTSQIAFSITTPQCCQLFPVQTWVIKPPNHNT